MESLECFHADIPAQNVWDQEHLNSSPDSQVGKVSRAKRDTQRSSFTWVGLRGDAELE